jgi:uncharacterized protein with NAD-binding domain and iron-sulfur cluster
MPNDPEIKVAVFGGGVGGLTVAHELVERGFKVEVYETNKTCGGKARSLEKKGTGTNGLPDLPGEHGFRFFPGFYQHLDDTMKRIPVGCCSTAFENLVDANTFAIAQEGKNIYTLPTDLPNGFTEWVNAIVNFANNPELGLATGESTVLAERILRIFSMCRERRLNDFECTTWWDYHDATLRSVQYNKMFVNGFSRAFVAMHAKEASTWTGGNILSQFFKVFFQTGTMDRVLNAPTNEAWITPWVDFLKGEGVTVYNEMKLTALNVSDTAPFAITSAIVENSTGAFTTVTADYYVAAIPVERMTELAPPNSKLASAAPSLGKIANLKTSWMNGIMFYLTEDDSIVEGHINFADSEWALTAISQAQFWNKKPDQYGDGTIKGILSVVISDWTTAGDKKHMKPAEQCTSAKEVADETWEQIKPHLPQGPWASAAAPVQYFLDPAITFGSSLLQPPGNPGATPALPPRGPISAGDFASLASESAEVANAEPLLINTACSLKDRPEAKTEIENLMLASDYVKTNIDLATMEGANEAGRRAVNEILSASEFTAQPCAVLEYTEPTAFNVIQYIDRVLFQAGGPPFIDILLP